MRFVTVGLMCLTLAACGSNGDKVSIPDGEGGSTTIESEGNKATFTSEDGKVSTINSGANSAKFADFAPQYPGSKIKEAASFTSEGKAANTVALSTADTPEKVRDFYKDTLAKAGMKSSEMNADGTYMLSSGSDVPSAVIMIAPEEGEDKDLGTLITIIANTKE